MITIDFFHDAVCGWCYVLSPRLRRWADHPQVQIRQRCFVLQRNEQEMIERFGSMALAKAEILRHWQQCQAAADDPARFNTEGMRAKPFSYPSGWLAALFAKAAEITYGTAAHWDMFDEIQRRHLLLNENIGSEDTLIAAANTLGFDGKALAVQVKTEELRLQVEDDIALARRLNVRSIPTLLINGKTLVSSTLTNEQLEQLIEQQLAEAA
jgi:predicted DsbA family dithiol-disulfide isomerase